MIWIVIAEVIAAIIGFGVAAELTAIGMEQLEPMMGQGMAGGVILGLLGALPETIFVIIATLSSSYQIALGSALGGNIILFTLGIGVVGVIYVLKWKKPIIMKEDYRVELYFLFASTVVMAILMLYGSLDRISGGALFLLYFIYVGYRYAYAHGKMEQHAKTREGQRIFLKGGAYLLGGIIIVLIFSKMFVGSITMLSQSIGISPLWLALVISPLAADLNENINASRMTMKSSGGGSTAIVSFIGSKLQNNTMLLGLIGLLAAQSVYIGGASTEFIAVIMVNLLAIGAILRGKLDYKESIILIIVYVAVVAATLLA